MVSPFPFYTVSKFLMPHFHTLQQQQHPPTAMLVLLCIYSRSTASSMSHQQHSTNKQQRTMLLLQADKLWKLIFVNKIKYMDQFLQ